MKERFLTPTLLFLLGLGLSVFFVPIEVSRVSNQIIGFPDESILAHKLRPALLALFFFLPFIGCLAASFCGILDRYILRQFTRCFLICFSALYGLLLLMEIQNKASDFKGQSLYEIIKYFVIQVPEVFTIVIPYSLMLSLLWSLGKLSKSKEIVSILQSGRSLFRFVTPFLIIGGLLSLALGILTYHWAPFSEAYKRTTSNTYKNFNNTAALNVGYGDPELGRIWTVGKFPKRFLEKEALEKVTISQTNSKKQLTNRYLIEKAIWHQESRCWTFYDVRHIDYTPTLDSDNELATPIQTKHEELKKDFPETPYQIIRPGLKPNQLGIPELTAWIDKNPDHPLSFKRAYQTWFHFRFAQPLLCLIIVLLSVPLGISFSRNTSGANIAIAILLSAIMLFCSEVFPTLGESGILPPALAAWATNIIFTFIAIYLFQRRLSGKPIYQILKALIPGC